MAVDADSLVREAMHIPLREARRWRHTPIEQEELVGEGALGLAKAIARYDPSRGVPFAAFATFHVRGAVVDFIRARSRHALLSDGSYAREVSAEALEDSESRDGISYHQIEDPRPQPPEMAEHHESLAVVETLPARERHALVRTVVDGVPAETVGRELGCTAERVYSLVRNASTRAKRRAA